MWDVNVHQRAAVAQVVLEGVPLPAAKQSLVEYASHQDAPAEVRDAISSLPDTTYSCLDDVGEAIASVQPSSAPGRAQTPSEESGAVPGGDAYVDQDAEPGWIRGDPMVLPYEQQLVREPAPVGDGIPQKGTRDRTSKPAPAKAS